ncbi:hypothetical protein AABM17_1616 [Neisseria musculi]|uniref:Uncharacterized protein n=2 Tax=Neisseria musculi TaxID=1815583 RepID=A0A7H1M9N0_9NEIS|nr:hypothetical protein H7A79_1616 [Neisseria musculi]
MDIEFLTEEVRQKILDCAAAESPREMCGFIVFNYNGLEFFPVTNRAMYPDDDFEISADDWLLAEKAGEIVAVVHSHPGGEPFLSDADRQSQTHSGLPWLLVVDGRLKLFRFCPHLRGRIFEYGTADCGTLVRDAFMLAGVDLPDHIRGDMDADAAAGYWVAHLQACGFRRIDDVAEICVGDVVLTALGGQANHAAFYLGGGEILHHAYGQLSRRELYNGYWRDCTHSVWRWPEWRPEMIRAVENDLEFSAPV